MVRDGDATRSRILAAALEEFAEHGLAGARVDRIAARARANKAQLYAYFGNKEALFDTVFSDALHAIVDAVPLDAEDLPGYAVRLYDDYLAHPELVRLATWSRLERRPTGRLTAEPMPREEEKIAGIASAQAAGIIDPDLDPADVFTAVIALSMAWSPASTTYSASAADDAVDHDRRRRMLHRIAARAFAPA